MFRGFLGRAGFNLLEMIIAAMVFVTIVVALLGVWAQNARMLRRDTNQVMASVIAQNIMESQVSLGFKAEAVPPTVFDVTHFVDGTPAAAHFTYQVDVTDTSVGPDEVALKQCVVTVSWEEDGNVKKLQLESMLGWQS